MGKVIITFENTAMHGKKKKDRLRIDEDGYYEVSIGALNVRNSAGQIYTADKAVIDLFANSGTFQRKIALGKLQAENGHPKMMPGMTKAEEAARMYKLHEDQVCGLWKKIWLKETDLENNLPGNLILIKGLIKPMGPYGDSLRGYLDDPGANCAFSLRGRYNEVIYMNERCKQLTELITFDNVTEEGISFANKYTELALESYTVCKFDAGCKCDIDQLEDFSKKSGSFTTEGTDRLPEVFLNDLKTPNETIVSSNW